jgi:hypothetical protein
MQRNRAALRRRNSGQAVILNYGLAILLGAATISLITTAYARQQQLEKSIVIADQMSYVAKASAAYIVANYTAFEQWFTADGVTTMVISASCVNAKNCTMPAAGTPVGPKYGTKNWQSLATAGYMVPEQSDINAEHQNYDILVHCSGTNANGCDQISAMVTTFGGPELNDSMNAQIADRLGADAGYIPQTAGLTTQHTTPAWLTSWNAWSVNDIAYATEGHIAITLDPVIQNDITGGAMHRYSGGSDSRPQTMYRSLFLGHDTNTIGAATAAEPIAGATNICFCGADGYYAGACVPPEYQGIANTPKSPNYCGVPPN